MTMSLSDRIDEFTGVRGVLGYALIIALFVMGQLWLSRSNQQVMDAMKGEDAQPKAHQPTAAKEEDEPDPPRNFTKAQLLKFNGTDEHMPLCLSVNGTVFDVSEAKDFYGPGGPYECFAGRECGVALAKMSFDETHLDDLEGCQTLNHGERSELDNWIEKFTHYKRYPILGRLVLHKNIPPADRKLTLDDIAKVTGTQTEVPEGYAAPPIYLGVGTRVFDVSFGGVTFYGPGGGYHRFAGKNAARALAKMSFDPADTANADTSDLTEKEQKVLSDWLKTFEVRKQYPCVGTLVE